MKKSLKVLSIAMISIFFLFSALPTLAEETYVAESAGSIDKNTSESAISEGTSESAISGSTSESAISEGTSESAISGSTSESAIEYDSDLLDVVLPLTVSITIDPYELNGKGQIYSDIYKIENLGSTDVQFTFTDMKVIFANKKDFKALTRPFDMESKSDLKAIYLVINFGRDDIPPVVLTDEERDSQVSIPIASLKTGTEDNSFSISFSGNLNENPAMGWRNGDVTIKIQYSVETIPTKKTHGLTGAALELDQTEAETTSTGAALELDQTETETTSTGAALELDQTEFALQGTNSSDEVLRKVTELVTTPKETSFKLNQAESALKGTGPPMKNLGMCLRMYTI